MIITVISGDRMNVISLPKKVAGQYWITEPETGTRLAGVEGVQGVWHLLANRRVKILDTGMTNGSGTVRSAELKPMSVTVVEKKDGRRFFVFCEEDTEDRQRFTKYLIRREAELKIGRAEDNDLCMASRVVSAHHASLTYRQGQWTVVDEHSTNGTFVNERRIASAALKPGDRIFIMGLKIIIGSNFIAVNDPDQLLKVSGPLARFPGLPKRPAEEEDVEPAEPEYFYRSPRFKRDIETAEFTVDQPPADQAGEDMPWFLVIGSSLAMGAMSLVTMANAIAQHSIMSGFMAAAMMVGTLLIPLISSNYEKKKKQQKEQLRQTKYRAYLQEISDKIDAECRRQEEILRENNVTIQECEDRILNTRRNLWDRTPGQNDFLTVRLGLGEGEADVKLRYNERRFTLDDDNLQNMMLDLCERPKSLHSIPITCSLKENRFVGIIGERAQTLPFAKGLLVQLASLYSYDEVKLAFLCDPDEFGEFEFVKWLPHVWNEDHTFRFVATNLDEVKELSSYLEKDVDYRQELSDQDMGEVKPQYILFCLSKRLAVHADVLREVLAEKKDICFSAVACYHELKDLPKECSNIIELTGGRGKLFDRNDISGKSTLFSPDIAPTHDPRQMAVHLANVPLDVQSSAARIPDSVTFMELYHVGKVEHLNVSARWKENDPTRSLAVPVGVDAMGEPFMLDLHEKYHGPHGLIAGMTGSGKSEFIITYILSLALNFHPDEVAFILIDYKGGGMAKSFEHLPHTAGIITNLDGAAINRSLVSIQSELKRRQAIFAAAGKKVGVSNISIYKYQKLYREGAVDEPLPHLFIISDEFAELKTQQPEFIAQLVSAARIGRSLGVHLILATQKPSGVVDDQIWSNSKFRVCLRVQDRADSMDMLKRPDAAALTTTGRFYLQVGYNELFAMGQQGWSGAPYYPSERLTREMDNSLTVIDMNGHPVRTVSIDRRSKEFANAPKQLDAITAYIHKAAEEENAHARPLWLEPIKPVILLDEVRAKYQAEAKPFVLDPVIGEFDDPANQRQGLLRLPLSAEGNAVVYGVTGAGKTSFLNAMITSLICEHTPDEVNIYLLDFASETLRAFGGAPHVGEVMLAGEEEKITNFFRMMHQEVAERRRIFADYGGDYESYIRAGKHLPGIVVAVNNYAAFTELYDSLEESVGYLAREGTRYGIYFVLTAPGFGSVRFRLLQSFKQLFTLQLNDESDYASIVGRTEGLLPAHYKGRGLVRTDALYEFQTAMVTRDAVPFDAIRRLSAEAASSWQGAAAPRVPILPEVVDREFVHGYMVGDDPFTVPVGVETASLNVMQYSFGNQYITTILSDAGAHTKFVQSLAAVLGEERSPEGVIFDAAGAMMGTFGSLQLMSGAKACEDAMTELFEMFVARNNTYKEAVEEGRTPQKYSPYLIIIAGFGALKKALTEDGYERLSLILERGTTDYQMAVIVADTVKALGTAVYEKWYKANVNAAEGLWVGSGIADQYTLKIGKSTRELNEELQDGFGYAVIKGRPVRIKLLNENGDEDDE